MYNHENWGLNKLVFKGKPIRLADVNHQHPDVNYQPLLQFFVFGKCDRVAPGKICIQWHTALVPDVMYAVFYSYGMTNIITIA